MNERNPERPLVVYIAGPYRAKTIFGRIRNILRARRWALKVWQAGMIALCPHMNTALFDGKCPDKVWLDGALELLSRCDAILLTPGWEDSKGSWAEHEAAQIAHMPTFTHFQFDKLCALNAQEETP